MLTVSLLAAVISFFVTPPSRQLLNSIDWKTLATLFMMLTVLEGFKKENIWLFDKLSADCGHEPVVVYSIAKSLNGLASDFFESGINWLYRIASKHSSIKLRDYQSSTIFYMEKLFNNYIRKNRMTIRRDNIKKQKIIDILSFMVERESVQAYMLREFLA